MPLGPNKMLPAGTTKKRNLEYWLNLIDDRISSSEGDDVFVYLTSAFEECKEEIIGQYFKAGWKHAVYEERYNTYNCMVIYTLTLKK